MTLRPSDDRERDRLLKHLKAGPPPERPPDYGRQSFRLVGEITEKLRDDYEASNLTGERVNVMSELEPRDGFDAMFLAANASARRVQEARPEKPKRPETEQQRLARFFTGEDVPRGRINDGK